MKQVAVKEHVGTEAAILIDPKSGRVLRTFPASAKPRPIHAPASLKLIVGTDEEIAAEKVTQDALCAQIKAAAGKAKAAPVETGK
jgi:hypothetical protein